MCRERSLLDIGRRSLFLTGMLALSHLSVAEPYEFKVVYAQVAGIEKAVAGDFDAAIAELESRFRDPNIVYLPGELATLCALYVVTGNLEDGQMTCNAAVENDESDVAYNNRGVLRASLGDSAGALQDFDRVRVLPEHKLRFIEDLKRRNARLMASRNYLVVTQYIDSLLADKHASADRVRGASIEDLNN